MNTIKLSFFGSAPFVLPIVAAMHNANGKLLSDLAKEQYIDIAKSVREQFKLSLDMFDNEVLQRPVELRTIVTQPDRINRKKLIRNTIAQYAIDNNIHLYQPEKIKLEYKEYFKNINATKKIDLGVVAAYGQILPNELFDGHKFGMLNWHPSLLPELRGPTPIQTALYNGIKISGLSWIEIAETMDAGDIYLQQELLIDKYENFEHLAARFADLGVKQWALVAALKILDQSQAAMDYSSRRQNYSNVTFCSMLNKDTQLVDLSMLNASNLLNHYRAYHAFPGTAYHSTYFKKLMKIVEVGEVLSDDEFVNTRHSSSSMSVHKELVILIVQKKQKVYLKCSAGYLELIKLIDPQGKQITLSGYQFAQN
jgi:methionyl-tRNA formyltransferase